MTSKGNRPSVPPDVYTRDYYQANCHGYAEFRESYGEIFSERFRIPLELAEISGGMRILDVGCGRGEILVDADKRGASAYGFDYAMSALEMATEAIAKRSQAHGILIHLANAQQLPYPDNCFDRVFMLDVVEHLYPYELHQALVEIRRVLRPTGRLIIHTMPNTWYYRWGYPPFRLFSRLRGKNLPVDPRNRWGYSEVHVNEQDLIMLRRELRAAGFKAKVWLQSTHSYGEEPNQFVRFVMRVLVTVYPFRFIFCDDLFAVATK